MTEQGRSGLRFGPRSLLGQMLLAVAVALLVANFVPGMSITIYALVIAWCAALYFFGPKISKASGKSSMSSMFGSPFAQAKAYVSKLWKSK